jgi:iron(III) transport system permease protein
MAASARWRSHRHRHGRLATMYASQPEPVPMAVAFAAAMPTYIIAYCFLELFDYSGALQTGLRQIFGWHGAKDYWFPDIRSVGGAIFVMSMVLYPYVYITARASFLAQSVCVLEVSRTLGRSAAATF